MQCPRCQQDNPPQAKFCLECGIRLSSSVTTDSGSHLQTPQQIEDLRRALAEAAEQQAATAEILESISSSPNDLQPVFDTIVRTAGLVCGAVDAVLWTTDGDELVVRAHHGPLAATIGARQPMHGSVAGYAVREARVVHVKDLTEADDFPVGRGTAPPTRVANNAQRSAPA